MLGKASMGLTGALAIAGITLSETAKKTKNFELILTEIEAQVRGVNKALGATATGGITQFKNAFGDLIKENLGEVLATAFSPWLRAISLKFGEIKFDAKAMGNSLRTSMLSAAKSMAPFLDALAGLRLALKTLKLAYAGFGLLMADVVKGVTNDIQRLFNVFGFDFVSQDTLKMINDAWDSQLKTVMDIKKEIADFTTDLGNNPPSLKVAVAIDKFDFESQVAQLKQRIGFVEGGVFAPAPASAKSSAPAFGKDPQLDEQTEVLRDIRDVLGSFGKGFTAVAG